MALAHQIICNECGERKLVASSSFIPPEICNDCRREYEAKKKEAHLQGLQALPIEERIREIEKWIYDHSRAHPGTDRVVL